MSFLSFLLGEKKKSAVVAKERLQIILAHERSTKGSPDYLPKLQQELIAVLSKYVNIDLDDIKVNVERHGSLDVLEVKIEMQKKEVS
ncbi:cell division topological specificity factor [Candidatus Kinetoplastibacterium oncopeltii TCC290E]|uniref:Cell division topological specificity factor n=1 Tax=Candidatus Kinetoplastidibacterium stringomonadis TCC290E TaxID=1208920 RepID=M1LWT6_9PROT|nr:cell division topological specificity factor MinE [Candidatus Kinetoplastibacterium oncopeltii]AGF48531.1 cell division topological specificity factor [Candidatus Kinetoplastibacterium oncopeltii TCC290E]